MSLTRVSLVILGLAVAFHQSYGLFTATPADECSRDYDCPRFDPRRPGKCIKKSRGILCGLLNRNRKCSYNVCAECLVNRDCAALGERTCLNNRCTTIRRNNEPQGFCYSDFDCPKIRNILGYNKNGKCVKSEWRCAECFEDRDCDFKACPSCGTCDNYRCDAW